MPVYSPFHEYVKFLNPAEFYRFRSRTDVVTKQILNEMGFTDIDLTGDLSPNDGYNLHGYGDREGHPSLHYDPIGNDLAAEVIDETRKSFFVGSSPSPPTNLSGQHISFLIRTPNLFQTGPTTYSFVPLYSQGSYVNISIVGTKFDVLIGYIAEGALRRENTTIDLKSFSTYFLTVAFTGETNADEIKLYVNGIKCNTLITEADITIDNTFGTGGVGKGYNHITNYDTPSYFTNTVASYAPNGTVFDELVIFDNPISDLELSNMVEFALGTNILDEIAPEPIVNRYPVISTHGVPAPISNPLEFTFTQADRSRKQFSFTQEYLLEIKAQSQFVQAITDIFASARAELELAQNIRLATQIVMSGGIDIRIGNEVVITGNDVVRLAQQHVMAQNLLLLSDARAQTTFIHTILDATDSISISDQPVVYINGRKIDILDADISIDENSLGWNARITLANINDYSQFQQDQEFELNLYGEIWNLIVDSKELSRNSVAEYQATLSAVSPIFKYDSPRSPLLDKVWDKQAMAHTIAQEAIDAPIIWNTVDWPLAANLVSVSNGPPIQVVQNLATAAGAIITSEPDGDIVVQPKHIVDIPDYFAQTAGQTYTEINDIFSVSESFVAGGVYNHICVMNSEGDVQDSIEYIQDPDDPQHGVLRVYPIPWREKEEFQLKLTDSSGRVDLNVGQPWERSRVESSTEDTWLLTEGEGELIEITDGTGSTQYPIDAINSLVWLSDVIGVAFSRGEKEFLSTDSDNAYGLIKMKYTVKYYEYDIRNLQDFDEVQAVLVDLRDI